MAAGGGLLDAAGGLRSTVFEEMTGLVPAVFSGTGSNSLGWHGQTILLRPALLDKAQVRRLPLPGIEPRGALALLILFPGITLWLVHLLT